MADSVTSRPWGRNLRHALLAIPLLLVVSVLAACAGSSSAQSFGTPVAGQRVYDIARVLTASEIADIEQHASAVAQAGAPVIIYLRKQDSTTSATVNDAKALMDAWDVQSATGAHDGLVIFLNLKPSDPKHGSAALYAGAKHANASLPQAELQRIYNQVMLPHLRDGNIAASITAALDAAQHDLMNGAPVVPARTPFQQALAVVAGVPMLIGGVFLAVLGALLGLAAWRRQPRATEPPVATVEATQPDQTQPALVGALVSRHISLSQLLASIMSLASQGALNIESARGTFGRQVVNLHLAPDAPSVSGFEAQVFDMLRGVAESDGLITPGNLRSLPGRWRSLGQSLRAEMVARGWFDPQASQRRRPLYLYATASLVISIIAFVMAAVAAQPLGIVGALVLFASSILGYVIGGSLHETTVEGENAAQPWRAYAASLKGDAEGLRAANDADGLSSLLDHGVPYAVAAG
ncbi:MAG TPA: TPM domain-containing protein, partial [Ktedonobacterales bacterium]